MRDDYRDHRLNFLKADFSRKQEKSDQAFEAKIVRMILTAAGVSNAEIKQMKSDNGLTLDDIANYNITLPVHLVTCSALKQELGPMFADITKTEIWVEFFNIRATITTNQYLNIGVVFRSSGGKILVAHDLVYGDLPKGYTRLQRLSADGEKVIVVEPLQGLLSLIVP